MYRRFLKEEKFVLKLKNYCYNRPIKTTLFSFSFIRHHFLHTISSHSPSTAAKTLSLQPTTPNSSSFTVQFLVNSCGLPLKSAISVSQKLHLHENNIHKTQAVLQFLKSHHFDDTQTTNLIKKWPAFLRCRVEENLKPKFDFLVANGFSGNLLPQIILSHPDILRRSLNFNIKPWFEFLKSYFHSNEKIAVVLKRDPWLLNNRWKVFMQPNVDFLIKEGVPLYRVAKLILKNPKVMQFKHDRMVYAVNYVKGLGIEPTSPVFIVALALRLEKSDTTWNKKVELMKSLGWSEEEVLGAFKRSPKIFSLSEEKIRTGIDFFMNVLKLGLPTIIARPELFTYSIDRRLRPRHKVLDLLVSEKLITEDKKNVQSLFSMSEEDFLEVYVTKYADCVPGLLEIYDCTSKAKKMDA